MQIDVGQRSDTLVVHVLRYGRALCPLSGIPREWPAGHKWVPIGDLENCTCPACKEVATALLRQEG